MSTFPHTRKEGLYRPILPIEFIYPHGSYPPITFEGLIDSGANFSVFPAWISSLFGHNLEKGKIYTCSIADKKIHSYLHEMRVKICGEEFNWNIYFSKDIDTWQFGVLGHELFFNQFKVAFNYPEKTFSLECLI